MKYYYFLKLYYSILQLYKQCLINIFLKKEKELASFSSVILLSENVQFSINNSFKLLTLNTKTIYYKKIFTLLITFNNRIIFKYYFIV